MRNRAEILQEIIESHHSIRRTMLAFHLENAGENDCNRSIITPAQWAVLRVVRERNQASVKEIAAELGVTSSAVTQLVDSLVNNGYLVRESDPKDRRTLILTLSNENRVKLRAIKKRMLSRLEQLFEALSDRELSQYARLNKKIADTILKERT